MCAVDKGGFCGVCQVACWLTGQLVFVPPTATWSAMFAHFKCSVNSCPCENTHDTPSAYCIYVCRIGLRARDYARVMVGNKEANVLVER